MMTWNEYLDSNDSVMRQIDPVILDSFLSILKRVRESGGKVWVLGNGGSASLASHAVVDFGKTVKQGGAKPLFTIASSEFVSMQTAYSNDLSFESGFASMIDDFGSKEDAVWIVSVSGTSPNLLLAARTAKEKGMTVLSTVGKKGESLAKASDSGILIDSFDYQVVENAHLLLMHWFTKKLSI
jgi:D-sedoheptulose 7-phosphate isomerase